MLLVPSTWSLAARIVAPVLVLGLLVAAVWGYGVRERRAGRQDGRTEIRAEWADAKERQRQVDAAERRRRETAHQEITRDAQDQTRRARADAAAAARTADGLRLAAAAALERRCDSAPTARGPSAPSTSDLLADVLGGLERTARELAEVADERGAAGAACERSYDALSVTNP